MLQEFLTLMGALEFANLFHIKPYYVIVFSLLVKKQCHKQTDKDSKGHNYVANRSGESPGLGTSGPNNVRVHSGCSTGHPAKRKLQQFHNSVSHR
jgi:hypothetical protein